jgi:hypothetical protein
VCRRYYLLATSLASKELGLSESAKKLAREVAVATLVLLEQTLAKPRSRSARQEVAYRVSPSVLRVHSQQSVPTSSHWAAMSTQSVCKRHRKPASHNVTKTTDQEQNLDTM